MRGLLSPAGRELVDALGAKIDREFRGTDTERDELKLHSVRKLAEKEAREGPVDPAYVRRQAAAWDTQAQEKARGAEPAREAERAPAPLLPAWRDPTGRGRDGLGRSTSPEELARVPAREEQRYRARVQGQPEEIRSIAWRAQVRLCGRFRKLAATSKPLPKVASERVPAGPLFTFRPLVGFSGTPAIPCCSCAKATILLTKCVFGRLYHSVSWSFDRVVQHSVLRRRKAR